MKNGMTTETTPQHWESIASVWAQLGSPLRPCAEDQIGYRSFIEPWIEQFARPRIIILGVTPEVYHLPWPAEHDLIALDRSRGMIEEVWPGPPECALEGDWLRMPLPNESRDLALCDGGLMLLDYPQNHRALVDQLHRVLVPGGRVILRLFAAAENRETVAEVLNDFVASRIDNLNILKLRLGAALQASPENGAPVREILRAVEMMDANLARLAQRVHWSLDHLRVIELYRESSAIYRFLSEAQITEMFCGDGRFAPLGRCQGTYPLAERCPIVAYERRRSRD